MPSELDLVNRFRAERDKESFGLLYRQVSPSVYRYIYRFMGSESQAAEVLQETWLRAIQNISNFHGRSTFRTWLTGIAINCCREILKRESRWVDLDDGEVAYFEPVTEPIDVVDLENALRKLSEGYREVLLLHDLEGFKHHEIADILGINEGTSKSQLSRARRLMRKLLQEE